MPPCQISLVLKTENTDLPSEYLKQKSPEWFEVRKSVKATGSTIHKAVGLDLLKKQRSYFDEIVSGEEMQKSDAQQTAMDYGSKTEINAVDTLVSKVLPVLCSSFTLYEEGTYKISVETSRPILCVSLDGSLRDGNGSDETLAQPAKLGIETKCPFNSVPLNSSLLYAT